MEDTRLYTLWVVGIVFATVLLFASAHYVNQSTIQVGILIIAVVVWIGPLLYEPRLQAIGWRGGRPADERDELIIFRTGWYMYTLLAALVLVYIFINWATDFTMHRGALALGFIVIFLGYWVIAWWQSKLI